MKTEAKKKTRLSTVPEAALEEAGLAKETILAAIPMDGVVLVTKDSMPIVELLQMLDRLNLYAAEMLTAVAAECGPCEKADEALTVEDVLEECEVTVPAWAREQAGIRFDAVVAIEIPDEKIVARMGGRRVCESCGASYHIVNIPPKTEGVCDVCGGMLVQRKDDVSETVRDRLEVYHRETAPLKGFYEARGILKTVEDQPTVAGTTQAILRELGVTE